MTHSLKEAVGRACIPDLCSAGILKARDTHDDTPRTTSDIGGEGEEKRGYISKSVPVEKACAGRVHQRVVALSCVLETYPSPADGDLLRARATYRAKFLELKFRSLSHVDTRDNSGMYPAKAYSQEVGHALNVVRCVRRLVLQDSSMRVCTRTNKSHPMRPRFSQ